MMKLHQMAEDGREDDLRRLLDALGETKDDGEGEEGARKVSRLVNEKDEYGETPLNYACMGGSVGCARLLVERGALVSITNQNGVTALHHSARLGRVGCVTFLLKQGSDVNMPDNSRWTPLHYAAFNNQVKCARLLLENGADYHALNVNNCSPLHLASSAGALDCVLLLIQHGAKLNLKDNDSNSPLALLPLQEKEIVHADKSSTFQKLGRDLRALVNSKSFSDVTFVVEGAEEEKKKSFYGHRNIIAQRSARLRELITDKHIVEINGISPLVFECFLEFLYTGWIEKLNFKDVESGVCKDLVYLMELLRVAELYSCGSLTEFCEETLLENLNINLAISFLIMTEERKKAAAEREWGPNPSELAKKCYRKARKICGEFLLDQINQAVESKLFTKLKREILVEILSDLSILQKHKPAEHVKRSRQVRADTLSGQRLTACTKIITNLMKDKDSWPFNQPVDPVALGIPTYFDVIKHPMDFGTIKEKLKNGQYTTMKAFAADVQLVFTNALTFNEPDSDIAGWARKLRKIFESQWEQLLRSLPKDSSPPPSPPHTPKTISAVPSAPFVSASASSVSTTAALPAPVPMKNRLPIDTSRQGRYKLGKKINTLSPQQLLRVVQIINESSPNASKVPSEDDSNGDIEIDLSDLGTDTLYRLQEYVDGCIKDRDRDRDRNRDCRERSSSPPHNELLDRPGAQHVHPTAAPGTGGKKRHRSEFDGAQESGVALDTEQTLSLNAALDKKAAKKKRKKNRKDKEKKEAPKKRKKEGKKTEVESKKPDKQPQQQFPKTVIASRGVEASPYTAPAQLSS